MTDDLNPIAPQNAAQSAKNDPAQLSNNKPTGAERRTGKDRRASVIDRRTGLDRRNCPHELKLPDMERRRGPGIRRPEERRSAEEGEMTVEQFEFVMAVEEYKRANNKTFPTWTEVLDVIKALGYHKDTPPAQQADHEPIDSEDNEM